MLRSALVALTLFACSTAVPPSSAADKPDFTGTWKLNVDKSNFGKLTKPVKMSLKSEYRGSVLHAVQVTSDEQGDRTAESNWYIDGKTHPFDDKAPGGKSETKWRGNTLVNERTSADGNYHERVEVSFSSDGKTATEKIWTKNPNGENRSTLVWERQSGAEAAKVQ